MMYVRYVVNQCVFGTGNLDVISHYIVSRVREYNLPLNSPFVGLAPEMSCLHMTYASNIDGLEEVVT